jgi:methoxymalonate biosynthesis protein
VEDRARTVKCLVWDLDNTLWQGTLTEDAEVVPADHIRRVVTTLDARGILQSVASRNDHDQAWAHLEELGLAEFLVLPRIGWGPKSESVRMIADELGFAMNTIAFIDDQPAERAEVAFHLPEVRCYAAEQVAELLDLAEFSPATITADSAQRRVMYQAGFRRAEEQAAFGGTDEEFLRSLDIVMRIARADVSELARVEELTLRTSQMNATGIHYDAATLRELLGDPGHEVLVVAMADRFGPHGAVGVLLLECLPSLWHLKLLATSCRVVQFGAGAAILNWLIDQAARAKSHLVADFRPTARNRIMEVAYRFAGFTDGPCVFAAGLAEGTGADLADVQRLHVTPARRRAPSTMALQAVDLAGCQSGRRVSSVG